MFCCWNRYQISWLTTSFWNFVSKNNRKSTKNDLVENTIHIKLNNMYEKENVNELKILPNDVHLVKLFSFFKNREF